MALGSGVCGVVRSRDDSRNRSTVAPVFRNACLIVLAAVSAVVASDPSSPQAPAGSDKSEAGSPQYLPSYTPSPAETPNGTPSKGERPPKTSKRPRVSPKSVLLPPIQALPEARKTSSAHASPIGPPAGKSSSGGGSPAPSLLDPPPAIGAAAQPGPVIRQTPSHLPEPAVLPSESTLEIVIGQPRLLVFPAVPERIALTVDEADPVATLKEVPHKDREWYVFGKKPGSAFLDVRLPDSTSSGQRRVLHYLVRVRKDPENKEMLEGVYQTLEREISRSFPGSVVHLTRAEDKIIVSGHARNIFEATRILKLARDHAPGARLGVPSSAPENDSAYEGSQALQSLLDNYAKAGGPRVVNLLRIPGEQQIMLRVVVTEVNRAAARSLGVDFGIGEKQATILSYHPTSGGASTLVDNGWIAQAIRTLQDLHYAQPLAEPTLTTLNGQTAHFKAGGEFPVPVVTPTPSGAVQGVAFRSYGVQLSVQPVVADTDRIRLTVSADVSATDPVAAAQVAGTTVPGLKVRNFQSTVELREGETLAVAGLIRSPSAAAAQSAGVGSPADAGADQELVVLISPLLIHSPEPANQPAGAAPSPLNAQNIELYLRSRDVVAPRGDALFLIGPQGYAGEARPGAAKR